VGATIGTEARALNNQAYTEGDRLGVVPGLPPSGKSGLYFLDPNINLMRDPVHVTGLLWPILSSTSSSH
jgi:hypothetical protein